MSHFWVSIQIRQRGGERFEHLRALVDAGSTYTWLPQDVLDRLGVRPEEEWPDVRF
jgi:predicted aspartyl protease